MILSLQDQLIALKNKFNKTTSTNASQSLILKTKNASIQNFIKENNLTDKLLLYNKTKEIFENLEAQCAELSKFKGLVLSPKLLTLGTYNRDFIDKEKNDKISSQLKSFITLISSVFLSNACKSEDYLLLHIHLVSFFKVNFFEKRFLVYLSLVVPEGRIKDAVLNGLELNKKEFSFVKNKIEITSGSGVYFEMNEIVNESIKHPIILKEIMKLKAFISKEIESNREILEHANTFVHDLKAELNKATKTKKLDENILFKINMFINNM
eukprot:GAHX01003381.1.p1 GENE.GAHX01003381.1~~GAHX01003381.1.p1  ORF type:complete len:267 (-),score=56.09 GAHX01003381.1:43-843(-)